MATVRVSGSSKRPDPPVGPRRAALKACRCRSQPTAVTRCKKPVTGVQARARNNSLCFVSRASNEGQCLGVSTWTLHRGGEGEAGNCLYKKGPALTGLSVGRNVERTTYAVRSTNRRLARPLRSLCDGDHKNALCRLTVVARMGEIGELLRVPSTKAPPRSPLSGVLLSDTRGHSPAATADSAQRRQRVGPVG